MPETAAALTSGLCAWLERLFPDRERGERLQQALRDRFGDDGRPVSAELCGEIETAAHAFSRHFALEFVGDGSLVPCDSAEALDAALEVLHRG